MASTSTTKRGQFSPVLGSQEHFRASDFNSNMDKIDAEAVAIDGRLDVAEAQILALDTIDGTLDARLDVLEGQTLDARLDVLEALNISTRLTTSEATDVTQNGRLTTLEGYNLNTRVTTAEGEIDAIQALDVQQNNRLAVLEIAAGNPPIDFSVDGGTP